MRIAVGADTYARDLAAALAAAFLPTCAWQWACTIDVVMAGTPLVTLRFQRHDAGTAESILDVYEYSWRELLGAPVDAADLGRYARAIMGEVAEARREAVLEHAHAASLASEWTPPAASSTPAWNERRRGEPS